MQEASITTEHVLYTHPHLRHCSPHLPILCGHQVVAGIVGAHQLPQTLGGCERRLVFTPGVNPRRCQTKQMCEPHSSLLATCLMLDARGCGLSKRRSEALPTSVWKVGREHDCTHEFVLASAKLPSSPAGEVHSDSHGREV